MGWTSTEKLVFFVTVPLATICAGILYYLYYSDDESWDDLGIVTKKTRILEIKVPTDKVPAIVGRGGAKIKEIQEATNTKINFKDLESDSSFKLCRIKGSQEEVEKAEILINELIKNQPNILTEEIWVPQTACGRIIGRCGETIKQISSQSNANVTIERYTPGVGKSKERQVVIRGTAQEIAVAVSLINAKVAEDAVLRSQVDTRSPRHRERGNIPAPKKDLVNQKCPEVEQLIAEANDSMTRVYVSSVASPDNFWVQMILPKSAELDQLGQTMTEFYSNPENRDLHKLNNVYKGQIVAALGSLDNRWYRVKVYEELKKDSSDPELDIYFVDYGESMFVKKSDCCELRTDFLSLRFQAIECALHNVKPPHGEKSWGESSIVEMEDLVYSAQWKPVLVKVVDFDKTSGDGSVTGPNGRPIVNVFDPERGVDVAEELIRRGLADRVLSGERKESDVSSEDMSTIGGGDESTASVSSLSGLEDSLMGDLSKGGAGDPQSFLQGEAGARITPNVPSSGSALKFADSERGASQKAGDGNINSPKPSKAEGKLPTKPSPVPESLAKSEEPFPSLPQPAVASKESIRPRPSEIVERKPIPPQAPTKTEQKSVEPKLPAKSDQKLVEPKLPSQSNQKPVEPKLPTKPEQKPVEPKLPSAQQKMESVKVIPSGPQKEDSQPFRYDPFKSEPSKSAPSSADDFLSSERLLADPTMPKKMKSPQEKMMQKVQSSKDSVKPMYSKMSNGNN